MQVASASSVMLDAQVGSATAAMLLTTAPFSLPTINKTETNNKVVISQNLLFVLRSFPGFSGSVKRGAR
jgi:hypothetical protein